MKIIALVRSNTDHGKFNRSMDRMNTKSDLIASVSAQSCFNINHLALEVKQSLCEYSRNTFCREVLKSVTALVRSETQQKSPQRETAVLASNYLTKKMQLSHNLKAVSKIDRAVGGGYLVS